ncbi:thiol:disulfide interchange protein DsbA/DsbL [uncultured Ferrimonas sp.]|uniref:thiol:disulfide interchange protein DsbA/DsbL n=1 Tax=uncultured Ferrimonas sp. TaxID=432640 RepID=UPI002634BDC2|nr:thiol:disulfide interchange protein DsbA/DsbL [uncultured Ferrimonas sp.]
MKKLIVALWFGLVANMAWAADFQEGVHYRTVNPVGSAAQPTVTEFFSTYCGNCYNMEHRFLPLITPELEKLGIEFEKKHVNFSGDQIGEDMVRGYATMMQLGDENAQLLDKLFELNGAKNHDHSAHADTGEPEKALKNLTDIRTQFIEFGYEGEAFDQAASSPAVEAAIKQWAQQQQLYEIYSIPAFVVNNRYLININKIETVAQLVELMEFLSKR